MDINKLEVGQRLRELRTRCGISRETAAIGAGVSKITIMNWESGFKEIRVNNLEKYLRALEFMGCFSSKEWVLYGKDALPEIIEGGSENIAVTNVLEILKATSNLFYYLNTSEIILYVNESWRQYLGLNLVNSQDFIKPGSSFADICSEEVYNICHPRYLECLDGERTVFSYQHGNEFSKSRTEVMMLYEPVLRSKDKKVVGIFGFLSSKVGA